MGAIESKTQPTAANTRETSIAPACPVSKGEESKAKCPVAYKNKDVFNVYSQKIDPTNQMPSNANQLPYPGQSSSLSTNRVSSSIAKGGTESDTWQYPSPQMFWNALVRKNKSDGANEDDMETVVAIHNNMNESTWRQVLEWEKLHDVKGAGREPKLLKFLGRPDELSPKARIKVLMGHPKPFDRHDWVVDRGGTEVRYVIDYYHDESGVPLDKRPADKSDFSAMKSIIVDVRPALDSPTALVDRVLLMPWLQIQGKTSFKAPSFMAPKRMITAEEERRHLMADQWKQIQTRCQGQLDKVTESKSPIQQQAADINYQKCAGSVICPDLVMALNDTLKANTAPSEEDLKRFDQEYAKLVTRLELFDNEYRSLFPVDESK